MNKAIFWDLLGTLGSDSKTLIRDFQFYDYAIEALKIAKDNGFLNILVTNQSSIGHGKIEVKEYEYYMNCLRDLLINNNCDFDEVYTCPHRRIDNCECKKPKTYLVNKAKAKYNINLNCSFMVGDSLKNDIKLANNAGMKGILVLTGEGKDGIFALKNTDTQIKPFKIEKNVLTAVKYICK